MAGDTWGYEPGGGGGSSDGVRPLTLRYVTEGGGALRSAQIFPQTTYAASYGALNATVSEGAHDVALWRLPEGSGAAKTARVRIEYDVDADFRIAVRQEDGGTWSRDRYVDCDYLETAIEFNVEVPAAGGAGLFLDVSPASPAEWVNFLFLRFLWSEAT